MNGGPLQPFEFLMIVVSIIVGLGITQLLGGVVRLLRGDLQPNWIHELWVVYVFLSLLQYCWSLFDLEAQADWVFLELVGLLVPPVLLYLVAALLFPTRDADPQLSRYYYAHRRPVFGLLALLMLFYSVQGWLQGQGLNATDLVRAIGVAGFVALAATRHRGVHAFLTLLSLAGLLTFIASVSYVLGSFEG